MPDELLRTAYSRNSAQYSHIAKLALHFYAHIGAEYETIKTLLCEHIVFLWFIPLVSYIYKNTMYISYMVNFLFVHILSMLIRLSMALKLP